MAFEKIAGGVETVRTSTWVRTTLMGLFGGILFGVIIQFWMGNMIDIGAMYGAHSIVRGWIAHLFHSVAGAFVVTGIVARTRLRRYASRPSRRAAVGLLYGFVLWAVFIGIILPMWLEVMTQWGGGTPLVDSETRFPASFIGFLTYGLVVSGGTQPPASAGEDRDNESGDTGNTLEDRFDSGFVWNTDRSDDQ